MQADNGTGIIKDDQAPQRPRQPQRHQPWSSSTVHAIEFSNHHHTAGEHTRTQSRSSPTGSKMNNLHAPPRKHKPTPNHTPPNPWKTHTTTGVSKTSKNTNQRTKQPDPNPTPRCNKRHKGDTRKPTAPSTSAFTIFAPDSRPTSRTRDYAEPQYIICDS